MIRVIVKYGSGDRKAGVISDSFISTEACALMRAKQELANFSYIKRSITLEMPHDPDGGLAGDTTDDFVFQNLSIYGRHVIMSRTITLSPTGAKDSVTMEQYREMYL